MSSTLVRIRLNLQNIKPEESLICTKYDTLIKNNGIVNYLYRSLNKTQQKIFEKYHESISTLRSIQLLDSEPGTGKTYLLGILAMSSEIEPMYCVYKTELMKSMQAINSMCHTTTSLTMKIFRTQYTTMFNVYPSGKIITPEYILYKLMACVKRARVYRYRVIIIDEYTILNPEQILLFCLYGLYYDKHIMFVGDRCQQNSIMCSSYHSGLSNYFLLNILTGGNNYVLDESMRCKDTDYNMKLQRYRKMVMKYTGNTRMKFVHIYELYLLFKSKFTTTETFENVTFFAGRHVDLTARVERLKNWMDTNKIVYFQEKWKASGDLTTKYSEYLYLVKGFKYIYLKKHNGQMPYGEVTIIDICQDDGTLIVARSCGTEYILKKEKIRQGDILDGFYKTFVDENLDYIYQYALWPLYVSTYHNGQGLTIRNDIELYLEGATCESIYVGLSRIQSGEQLKKIHISEELLNSLEYTYHMNDEYFYKILLPDENEIKRIKYYKEINQIRDFEQNNYNNSMRILRNKYYLNDDDKMEDSLLMKVCRLIKRAPNTVRNFIDDGDYYQRTKFKDLWRDDIDINKEVEEYIKYHCEQEILFSTTA